MIVNGELIVMVMVNGDDAISVKFMPGTWWFNQFMKVQKKIHLHNLDRYRIPLSLVKPVGLGAQCHPVVVVITVITYYLSTRVVHKAVYIVR